LEDGFHVVKQAQARLFDKRDAPCSSPLDLDQPGHAASSHGGVPALAAAAGAMAVPPMPVECTGLISTENMAGKNNRQDARAQSFLQQTISAMRLSNTSKRRARLRPNLCAVGVDEKRETAGGNRDQGQGFHINGFRQRF
jgi:hypothetical protein